jgi:hypothetical protein
MYVYIHTYIHIYIYIYIYMYVYYPRTPHEQAFLEQPFSLVGSGFFRVRFLSLINDAQIFVFLRDCSCIRIKDRVRRTGERMASRESGAVFVYDNTYILGNYYLL